MIFSLKSHGSSCGEIFLKSPLEASKLNPVGVPERLSTKKTENGKTLSVIIPVYREFFNGNIFGILRNFHELDMSLILEGTKVQIVFVVNNTVNASKKVKSENQKTVDFLNQKLREEFLEETLLIDGLKEMGVKLIVVNRVYYGFIERSIGSVRNLGLEEALASSQHRDLNRHFIVNLDADTRVPDNYLTSIDSRFSDNPGVKAIFFSRQFYVEPGSHPFLYSSSRMLRALDVHRFFMDALNTEKSKTNNYRAFGGPQIAVRASELKEIGGVPRVDSGEDIRLARILRNRGGVFRDLSLVVRPADRARPDGYDAKIRLEDIQKLSKMPGYRDVISKFVLLEFSLEKFLINSLSSLKGFELVDPLKVKPLFDFFDIPFYGDFWVKNISKFFMERRQDLSEKLDWTEIHEFFLHEYLPIIPGEYMSKIKKVPISRRILPWFLKNIPQGETALLTDAIRLAKEKDLNETLYIQSQLKLFIKTGQTKKLKGRAKEFFEGNQWIGEQILSLKQKGLSYDEIFQAVLKDYPDWFSSLDKVKLRSEEVILFEIALWIHRVRNNPSDFPKANEFLGKMEELMSEF